MYDFMCVREVIYYLNSIYKLRFKLFRACTYMLKKRDSGKQPLCWKIFI